MQWGILLIRRWGGRPPCDCVFAPDMLRDCGGADSCPGIDEKDGNLRIREFVEGRSYTQAVRMSVPAWLKLKSGPRAMVRGHQSAKCMMQQMDELLVSSLKLEGSTLQEVPG